MRSTRRIICAGRLGFWGVDKMHTPGPWRAFCGKAITQVTRDSQGAGDATGSVLICHIAGAKDADIRKFNGPRWEADACLMAASPDLLAALKGMVSAADHENWHLDTVLSALANTARAAIAKAEGLTGSLAPKTPTGDGA